MSTYTRRTEQLQIFTKNEKRIKLFVRRLRWLLPRHDYENSLQSNSEEALNWTGNFLLEFYCSHDVFTIMRWCRHAWRTNKALLVRFVSRWVCCVRHSFEFESICNLFLFGVERNSIFARSNVDLGFASRFLLPLFHPCWNIRIAIAFLLSFDAAFATNSRANWHLK